MATKSKFHTQDGIKTLGNAEIDGSLTVTGNFTVNGEQTIIDSTTQSVTDSMIELASGNTTSDTLDVGIYGNYNDGLSGEGDVSEYTGLFRDASDSTWKLYDGLEVEPTTTVNTSGSGFTLADLQVGDLTATTLTATNSITGASITYPTTDGTNGQAIITDGSGGLSFGTIDASTDGIITSGTTTIIQSQDDTNVIHVNNSAQVGIGTASPATDLHVYHPSSHSEIRVGTSGSSDAKVPAVSFNNTVVEWGIGVKADNHLHIRENTASYASRVTIADGGNVGIGTQAPSTTLHVTSPAASNKSAIITRSSGAEAVNLSEMQDYNALQILNKSSGSYLNFAGNASHTSIQAQSNGSTAEDIVLNPYGGNVLIGTSTLTPNYSGGIRVHSASNVSNIRVSSGDKTGFDMMQDTGGTAYLLNRDNAGMNFYTNNTERMRIDSSGDVFIGQTAQTGYGFAQKLVVGDGDDNEGITIQSGPTGQGNLAFNHSDGTTAHGRISYQQNTNYMQFFTNNTERVRIDTLGHVGIGQASPKSGLDVYGAVAIAEGDTDLGTHTHGAYASRAGSGCIKFTAGYSGTLAVGRKFVFKYAATSWKAYHGVFTIASTQGFSKHHFGGYWNNSGASDVDSYNGAAATCAISTDGQAIIVTLTLTASCVHPMVSVEYHQSGGDGAPRMDKAEMYIQ